MAEARNDGNTPPALSNIDTLPSASSQSSDDHSPSLLDIDWTSDGTWNVYWTLPQNPACSTPWYCAHIDRTDNASPAFQPSMSSGSVDGAMPSTGHGFMQEPSDMPGNDVRLYTLLQSTEMLEVAGTSLFNTMGGSSDASVPSTSSAPIQQQTARFLGLTNDVPLNTAQDTIPTTAGLVDQLQSGSSDFLIPMDNTGAFHTLLSSRQECLVQVPGSYGNNPSTSGATTNYHRNMEYHQADHPLSFYDLNNGSTGVQRPTSIRSGWDAVPSTSHERIVQPSATLEKYSSDATGSTQWEQRKGSIRDEVNQGKKPPRERPHECEICKKSFKRSFQLVEHRRIHTGKKPYRCDICAKRFTQQCILTRHSRTHSGERPYQCATCTKSFAQSASLRRHQLTHSGEKPYQCAACAQSFTRLASLCRHERTHTAERPCKCEICGHSFPTCYSLKKHQRVH